MAVAADPHSIRYFAWLYSSSSQKPRLEALYGIEHELAQSLRPGLDHHIAHARLQWWREECQRTAQGGPVHPLTRRLVASGVLPARLSMLSGFVDTASWDLAGATFETRAELTRYCGQWAAAMLDALVSPAPANSATQPGLLPPRGQDEHRRWLALGSALRELEMLAHIARDAHQGRLRVPLDELERVGANPAELARPPWSAALATLLRERHRALRGEIVHATGKLSSSDQLEHRGVLVWSALAWHSSRRAERALPNPVQPDRASALADAWRAWRQARQASSGRFRLE